MIPLMVPPPSSILQAPATAGPSTGVGGEVIVAVPERARPAGEPVAVPCRRLVGQLLPLGLAFLLGLGDRDHDAGVEPA
jgi:hypothetical protein